MQNKSFYYRGVKYTIEAKGVTLTRIRDENGGAHLVYHERLDEMMYNL